MVPDLESHFFDITRVIQLSIAPVFLLTAIGTFINALAGRLARAVDRRRTLDDIVPTVEGEARQEMLDELSILGRRIRLVLWAMAFTVFSAVLVCLLIGTAFVGAFVSLSLARPVALLFVAAVLALTIGLMLFMREVFLAALTFRHLAPGHPERVDLR